MIYNNKKSKQSNQYNKRSMGHNAHLRNQFKSIHTFEKNYEYIITLMKR